MKKIIVVLSLIIGGFAFANHNSKSTKKITSLEIEASSYKPNVKIKGKLEVVIGRTIKAPPYKGVWICQVTGRGSIEGEINFRSISSSNVYYEQFDNNTADLYLRDLGGQEFDGIFNGAGEENTKIDDQFIILAKDYKMIKGKYVIEGVTFLYKTTVDTK